MDKLSLIRKPIQNELDLFRSLFVNALEESSNELLNGILKHILQRKGKLMRPIFLLLVARLFGEVNKSTLYAAVSLELLHTASLVHDDVVDETLERRGQPSINAMFNNKVSVLSGDFILATCLAQASLTKRVDIIQLISFLGQQLAEGELLQLAAISEVETDEATYFEVIDKKTGALFAACAEIGALSVDAFPSECKRVRQLGSYVGICFQLKDDLFDYFESEELGKPTGNDIREGKLTLPALYATSTCKSGVGEELLRELKGGNLNPDFAERLVQFTIDNGGIEYAQKVMMCFQERAKDIVNGFEDSEVKSSLLQFIDYIVERRR